VLGAGRHLEGHGENGHSNDNNNANGESHGAPLLEPPPTTSDDSCEDDGGDVGCLSRVSLCLGDADIGYWWLRSWRLRWQWRERGWCSWSRVALFLPELLGDAPTHVHADC
jgi:hypothetical protein